MITLTRQVLDTSLRWATRFSPDRLLQRSASGKPVLILIRGQHSSDDLYLRAVAEPARIDGTQRAVGTRWVVEVDVDGEGPQRIDVTERLMVRGGS